MMYDNHLHTLHSHDSSASLKSMCEAAFAAGLTGILITDHCDGAFWQKADVEQRVRDSWADVFSAKELWNGRLQVLAGLELGEAIFVPTFADKVEAMFPYDAILASVHCLPFRGSGIVPFSVIDFSSWDRDSLIAYVREYYRFLLETVRTRSFQILAHVNVIMRYINGKYGKNLEEDLFAREVEQILRDAAERNLTLEINTSGFGSKGPQFMPGEEVVRLFREAGGTRITLGSDAHTPENVAHGFQQGTALAKGCGFTATVHFEQKKPVFDLI